MTCVFKSPNPVQGAAATPSTSTPHSNKPRHPSTNQLHQSRSRKANNTFNPFPRRAAAQTGHDATLISMLLVRPSQAAGGGRRAASFPLLSPLHEIDSNEELVGVGPGPSGSAQAGGDAPASSRPLLYGTLPCHMPTLCVASFIIMYGTCQTYRRRGTPSGVRLHTVYSSPLPYNRRRPRAASGMVGAWALQSLRDGLTPCVCVPANRVGIAGRYSVRQTAKGKK